MTLVERPGARRADWRGVRPPPSPDRRRGAKSSSPASVSRGPELDWHGCSQIRRSPSRRTQSGAPPPCRDRRRELPTRERPLGLRAAVERRVEKWLGDPCGLRGLQRARPTGREPPKATRIGSLPDGTWSERSPPRQENMNRSSLRSALAAASLALIFAAPALAGDWSGSFNYTPAGCARWSSRARAPPRWKALPWASR